MRFEGSDSPRFTIGSFKKVTARLSRVFSCILLLLILALEPRRSEAEARVTDIDENGQARVAFAYDPETSARSVGLAGDFNDWNPTAHPMRDPDGDGLFGTTLTLEAPGRYEYKFVVNGALWRTDPGNPDTSGEGEFANSVLIVPGREGGALKPIQSAGPESFPPEERPRPQDDSSSAAWLLNACLMLGLGMIVLLLLFVDREDPSGRTPRFARLILTAWIGLLAWSVRHQHLTTTTLDLDEGVYVPLSLDFAHGFEAGELEMLIDHPGVPEHPKLALEVYAASILTLGAQNDYDRAVRAARLASAACATIACLLIAWSHPIAAIFLSLFGLGLHYTAVAYLDGPLMLFSTACLLTFRPVLESLRRTAQPMPVGEDLQHSSRALRMPWGFLFLSAMLAGASVSTKYLAVVGPLVIAGFFATYALRTPDKAAHILTLFGIYAVVALTAMVATDLHLWTFEAPKRVLERLTFHRAFSQGDIVAQADLPWFQPIVWLWNYTAIGYHLGWGWLDRSVTALALIGVPFLFRREPLYAFALLGWLGFLFLWPTKWPQYLVVVLPWLCISAQAALEGVVTPLIRTPAVDARMPREPAPKPETA